MELNTLSKITCYSRKLSLKNFINKNNKVTLIFSKKDYNDYDFIEVIIKNTKNKEEFTCPFTINSSNSITIEITFPSSVKKLSLPKNNISIQSLITSLGVYCSPAAEFSVNLLNISS